MKTTMLICGLLFISSIMLLGISIHQVKDQMLPYKDQRLPIDDRVQDLLGRLTLQEKISLLGGTGFATKPIPRLDIPELKMSDGPLGVRWDKSTAFPAATCIAASWDTSLVNKVGKSIAEELKSKGRNVILGPCVNIARLPLAGRTFEAYGEDPYLASRMAVSYIEGVQSEGVAATVKHFAANNQEYERMFVNEKIDHRTLNEIYFPAFKAAVEDAKVLCVMSAYNKINGQYCSENDYLLKTKLKDDWNFDGLVMSDWGAVHSSIPTANSALDLEMPTGQYLNEQALLDSVKAGVVKEETINDKVRRILTVMFKLDLFDENEAADTALTNTPEHRQVAYQAAVEGIVLLKNKDNVLPLNLDKIKSIAILGPNAAVARTTGGGSAMVNPIYSVSPLEALRNKLGDKIKINFAEGVNLSGDIKKLEYLPSEGGTVTRLGLGSAIDDSIRKAVQAAKESDVAIVFAGTSYSYETEGKDRDDLTLPAGQDELIKEVAKANKNTFVVMITGSPVLMSSWIGKVNGLVQAWFGGDEAGNAIADVLLGKYDPSGKLPITFPARWKDCSAYDSYKKQDSVSVYSDGIFVGYRWFDEKNIKPLFPFGYGLSYTTFSYNNVDIKTLDDAYEVMFKVKNTGSVEGVEIPELYVHDPDKAIVSPVKELKRFDRISLKPGETKDVKFILKKTDFAHYDADKEEWITHPGTYEILIGSSSRDLKLEDKIQVE